jgi:hypothetical protein
VLDGARRFLALPGRNVRCFLSAKPGFTDGVVS